MTTGWFIYAVLMVWLVGQCVINWRERKHRREWAKEHATYAHCRCGQRMSEWFINGGYMWHPHFAGGCNWTSPWMDHEHYRETAGREEAHL